MTIDVYNLGDPRPCIPPRVMASSAMWLKLGRSSGFCRPCTQKTNANTMRPWSMWCFTRVLSSRSDRSRCRWHTHLINRCYFDYGKNLKTPSLSPMPESRWHVQVLRSPVYIYGYDPTLAGTDSKVHDSSKCSLFWMIQWRTYTVPFWDIVGK